MSQRAAKYVDSSMCAASWRTFGELIDIVLSVLSACSRTCDRKSQVFGGATCSHSPPSWVSTQLVGTPTNASMRRGSLIRRFPSPKVNENGAFSLKEDVSSKAPRKWNFVQTFLRLHPIQALVTVLLCMNILIFKTLVFHWNSGAARIKGGPHPLTVMVQDDNHVISLALQAKPIHYITERRNRYWLNHYESDSDDSDDNKRPTWPKKNCEALGEWMTSDACNCNTFHEISMNDFTGIDHNTNKKYPKFGYIRDGGFRIAWMTAEYNGTLRVLKTLKYMHKHDFDLDNYERHRRDAVAMEQLTASPYIADIYGHCAQSALVDYSEEASLYHIFDYDEAYPSYEELFQIAYDAVAAVADTHYFNADDRATIAHMDIKPNQFIYLDDRYQLNDYNLAKFLSWNPEKNQYCGHTSGYSAGRVSHFISRNK